MLSAERFKPVEPQCPGCGDPSTFVAIRQGSGEVVRAWCADCDKPVNPSRFYSRATFDAQTFAELKTLAISNCAKCQRCGKMEKLERHHYAPRAQFGDGCEDWATGDLCRPCHEFWHDRMGQSIGSMPARPEREILRSLSPIERLAKKGNNNGW